MTLGMPCSHHISLPYISSYTISCTSTQCRCYACGMWNRHRRSLHLWIQHGSLRVWSSYCRKQDNVKFTTSTFVKCVGQANVKGFRILVILPHQGLKLSRLIGFRVPPSCDWSDLLLYRLIEFRVPPSCDYLDLLLPPLPLPAFLLAREATVLTSCFYITKENCVTLINTLHDIKW